MPKPKVNSEPGLDPQSPWEPTTAPWPAKRPSDHTLVLMLLKASRGEPVLADCIYGCKVEADGVCEHGHPSWLLRLGYV